MTRDTASQVHAPLDSFTTFMDTPDIVCHSKRCRSMALTRSSVSFFSTPSSSQSTCTTSSSSTKPVTGIFIQFVLLLCFMVPFASGAVCTVINSRSSADALGPSYNGAPSADACTCGTLGEATSEECTTSTGLVCTVDPATTQSICTHAPACTKPGNMPNDGTCKCGPSLDCTARTGLYCNIANNIGTCGCPAGQVKDSVTKTCTACTPGRFTANRMALGECEACHAGQYTSTHSATSCTVCEDGKYSTLGALSCKYCKVGRGYIDKATECGVCLGGQYQPSDATLHAKCTLCPVGYFNSDTGDNRIDEKHEECTVCNIAEGFVTGDQGGAMFCIGCLIGKFTTEVLGVPCQDCPAGWKGVQNGQINTCLKCNVGEYQSEDGVPYW